MAYFDGCRRGQSTDIISACVTRIADQVLVVWHSHAIAELTYAQMLRAERIARVGLAAESIMDGMGAVVAVMGTVQDVSDGRLLQTTARYRAGPGRTAAGRGGTHG